MVTGFAWSCCGCPDNDYVRLQMVGLVWCGGCRAGWVLPETCFLSSHLDCHAVRRLPDLAGFSVSGLGAARASFP